MSRVSDTNKRRAIIPPTEAEDAIIVAAAMLDPDAQPLTDEQLSAMVPLRTLRGRPKSANPKVLLSVRYSPEVVDYFKSLGDGWQSKMDGVLREHVARRERST
jgi:uncharacterized protein (DUF4415 family)